MSVGLKGATTLLLLLLLLLANTIEAATIRIIDANPSAAPVTIAPTPAPTKPGDVVRAVDTTKIALVAGSSRCTGDAIIQADLGSDFQYPTTSTAMQAFPAATMTLLMGAVLTLVAQAIM